VSSHKHRQNTNFTALEAKQVTDDEQYQ